ncbi:hypothetical protein SCHPADRAFT_898688 [Schizopora paradoxa]|uniref:F-box domain-containing protein n=1 Tax=Schizopora paradoxa TaxID=27342 RepID=A0A0H2S6Y6_9AGAM|nr:hypothetical protein SCHPADRAFT_898688 [Schizopora paradoxa]
MGRPHLRGFSHPYCARWRSCSWRFVGKETQGEEYRPCTDSLSLFHNVNAPLLGELSIKLEPGIGHLFDSFKGARLIRNGFAWNVPKLSTLNTNTTSGIPVALQAQLHCLEVNFCHIRIERHIVALLSRLTSMTNVSTIRLSFIDCTFGRRTTSPWVSPVAEFPSVQSVSIALLGCMQDNSRALFLWDEFRRFYFPNAIELDITLDIGDRDKFVLWDRHNVALYSFLAPNKSHSNRYPSLETLNVVVQSGAQSCQPGTQDPLPTMLVPHCCVPTLKHFRIQSMQYWTLLDGLGEFEASKPSYFAHAGEIVPIALETMIFDAPHVDGITLWVRQLSLKMQSTGCWDRFSELTVIQDGETAIISRGDVEHWCEARSP